MTVPRSGWVKPESDRRLSDLVSVGLLTRVFPADVVDAVVAAAGRTELRQRALPARVVTVVRASTVWFLLCLVGFCVAVDWLLVLSMLFCRVGVSCFVYA